MLFRSGGSCRLEHGDEPHTALLLHNEGRLLRGTNKRHVATIGAAVSHPPFHPVAAEDFPKKEIPTQTGDVGDGHSARNGLAADVASGAALTRAPLLQPLLVVQDERGEGSGAVVPCRKSPAALHGQDIGGAVCVAPQLQRSRALVASQEVAQLRHLWESLVLLHDVDAVVR